MATIINLGVAGVRMGASTLNVSEMRALVVDDGVPQGYKLHIFLIRLECGKWLVADSDFYLSLFDVADRDAMSIARSAPFPFTGRPYLGIPQLSDQEVNALRVVYRLLGELRGLMASTVLPTQGSSSSSSMDTASEVYGLSVSGNLLAEAYVFIPRGQRALGSDGTVWSVAELSPGVGHVAQSMADIGTVWGIEAQSAPNTLNQIRLSREEKESIEKAIQDGKGDGRVDRK